MKKISVIVPIYNALEDVKFLLESLVKNFNFNLGQIILINDCSNEETSNFLLEFCQKNLDFKLINNEENLGFIKTCNKGMKFADTEIIVLLNSDTIIPSNFGEKIIKCFNSDKKIGLASPISSSSNAYYIHMRDNISLEEMNIRLETYHTKNYPMIPEAEGFCFCIRKEVIENQGYLDEVYGKGYHEEVDYSYRALTNGWKIVLIDDLYVYHKSMASFGNEQREKQLEQNDDIFYSRWKGFRQKYKEKNKIINPVIEIEHKIFNSNKLLIHIHLSKTELLDDLIEILYQLNNCNKDLFLTFYDQNDDLIEKLKKLDFNINFIKVDTKNSNLENFIQILELVNLNNYASVLRINLENSHNIKEINHFLNTTEKFEEYNNMIQKTPMGLIFYKNNKSIFIVKSNILQEILKLDFYKNKINSNSIFEQILLETTLKMRCQLISVK